MENVQDENLRGSECILIVDDSESIRSVAEHVLLRLGYSPLLAADGESALSLYRERREEISLVVLDLIIPGMDGRCCMEELLKVDPGAKIIVASGYPDGNLPKVFLDAGAKEFVTKPYDMKNLARLIRRILDSDK